MIQTEFVLHMRNKCIICHVPEGACMGQLLLLQLLLLLQQQHMNTTTTLKKLQKLADQCCKRASTAKQRWEGREGGGGKFKK
jgi:hypothetical protein